MKVTPLERKQKLIEEINQIRQTYQSIMLDEQYDSIEINQLLNNLNTDLDYRTLSNLNYVMNHRMDVLKRQGYLQ